MGVFDTNSSSSQADGSNNANSQTGSGVTLLPTITAGDDIKNMSLTNNVSVNYLDNGAIEQALRFAGENNHRYYEGLDSMMSQNSMVSEAAINAVGMANDGANALSELAIMEVGENADTFMSLAGDMVESNANLAQSFGGDLAYLTDSVIDANYAQTDLVLNNNNYMLGEFADGLERSSMRESELMQNALASNTALSSQFASDLTNVTTNYSNNLADLTSQSMTQNAQLVSQYGSDLTDLTSQTQTALTEMAVLQEAGLDNALQIAGSMAMDDNSEASTNMVKYVMLGIGALGVAMVFKR